MEKFRQAESRNMNYGESHRVFMPYFRRMNEVVKELEAHVLLPCSMWSDGPRRDVPSAERREDRRGTRGRERHRPPRRLTCPHGGHSARRLCRAHGPVPADRGQACEGDDTRPPGPCAGPRAPPRHPWRPRLQSTPHATAPTARRRAAPLRRGRRATTAGPTTGPLRARGVLPTHGRALGAATLPRDGDPREARMGAGGAWGWPA
jgi:hypothetical protein